LDFGTVFVFIFQNMFYKSILENVFKKRKRKFLLIMWLFKTVLGFNSGSWLLLFQIFLTILFCLSFSILLVCNENALTVTPYKVEHWIWTLRILWLNTTNDAFYLLWTCAANYLSFVSLLHFTLSGIFWYMEIVPPCQHILLRHKHLPRWLFELACS